MFDIPLRRVKEKTAKPICDMIPASITPGLLTLLAFISGLACCYTVAISEPCGPCIPAILLWVINRVLDSLDGTLARSRGIASELGGFLDLLSDFIIYSLLPISVAFQQRRNLETLDWVAVAMLESSFHINNFVLFYTAAVASTKVTRELTSVSMQPALVEGFEAGLLFSAMLIWPFWISQLSCLMSFAVGLGTLQRAVSLFKALRNVKGEKQT